jgi:CheY-like chemotaxis protein
VDSGLKEGTTFTIYLPACRKKIEKEKSQAISIINGSETVLLVDDEDMIVEVGSQLLSRLGYKVLTAKNGREALDIYESRKNEISCVILDMIMPGQNGSETFDRLRRVDGGIKVLLSSGYSQDGQAEQIMQRGCSGFIQKPFTLEDLSGKIRQVLEGC